MKLTDREKGILAGREGASVQVALSSLVDLGEQFGAEELIAVSQAQIDATVYMVDAQIEFAERLADLGARVGVPSSLNAASIDLKNSQALRVPESNRYGVQGSQKCRVTALLSNNRQRLFVQPTGSCRFNL